MNKRPKVFGVSYGLIGDLVMGLPCLTYFERKYPGSYKIWAIEKKVSHCAPIFLNHPLIDRIHILGDPKIDTALYYGSEIQCTYPYEVWGHSAPDWYNYNTCVEETAIIAGITDLTKVLSPEELVPKLEMWFEPGYNDNFNTYAEQKPKERQRKTIAIWPSAARIRSGESPSVKWWSKYVSAIYMSGHFVSEFGTKDRPYFNQVKAALACDMAIGPDTGAMWVMAAYGIPCINLMTNWLPNHTKNMLSLAPVGPKAHNIFAEGGVENITVEEAVEKTLELLR